MRHMQDTCIRFQILSHAHLNNIMPFQFIKVLLKEYKAILFRAISIDIWDCLYYICIYCVVNVAYKVILPLVATEAFRYEKIQISENTSR